MSWKSIACIAALGAMAAPAMALPSISVVDNGGGVGSINITTTAAGSIAAEIALELSGATLTGATVNSGIFDTANPGDSPYIAGSPVGGDATGLVLGLPQNRLFAAFGSASQPVGTYKLLDFTYTGSGSAAASGLAASIGVVTPNLSASATIGTVVPTPIFGDTDGDGDVDASDFNNVRNNFGLASPPALGNADGVPGLVDASDFNAVRNNFGQTNPLPALAVSVPEPTTLVACFAGLLAVAARRR